MPSRGRLLVVALAAAFALMLLPRAALADLAHGKTATASSQETAALGPANAVDGDISTRWSSAFQDNQWWQVDLGSNQQVNEVVIDWETAYASQYKIQTSTDGTTFTTQATVNITGSGTQDTTFGTVTARYVRILGVTRATPWGISFFEVNVYGPTDPNPGVGSAGPLPTGFRDVAVFSGLAAPTSIAFAPFPDNRVFVGEKTGDVVEFDSLSDSTPTLVADLRTATHNFWDRGLLGVAVDPQFPARPYIYVSYTYDAAIGGTAPRWGTANTDSDGCPNPPGATTGGCVVSGRLSRLTIDPATNQMTAETVLINDWCQQFPSHSIGALNFGPDGALYMTGGEGANFSTADYGQFGSPNNPCNDPPGGTGGSMTLPTAEGGSLRAQSIRRASTEPVSLDGSLIRVNPDTGAGMADNPFAASTDANRRRIVAEGFRNPFRFTFRPGTNELWIGDVGEGVWEEIDRDTTPTSFKNYGWPCYEGTGQHGSTFPSSNICTGLANDTANGPTDPYYEYNHNSKLSTSDPCPTANGSSITGITFYNGGNYPSTYNGALFFADHTRNCIWVAKAGSNGLPDMSTVSTFDSNPSFPVDLQRGPGGDLYYASLDRGTINRIQYTAAPTNTPPIAKVAADKTSGTTPLTVNFDGSGSTDPDAGDTLTYSWDLNGDGTFGDSTAAKPSFTYNTAGTYTVKLKVTDSHNASDTASITITAGNTPPHAVIDTPASTLTWAVGDLINFSGHATDAEDGTLGAAKLTWSLIIHHCPTDINSCHTHDIQSFSGVASGSFNAPDHEYPSYLELQLKATDSGGLTDTTSVRLDPKTTHLNFASAPTGATLTVNSVDGTTPFSRTVIVGSANTITAPTPQTIGGTPYDFASWSDSGAATHTVTAPSADTTYTANYTANTSNVNLALNKTATSSSNESASFPPKNGNDGSTSTRWSSAFKDNQWWQVDLGSNKTVGKVVVNWETAYASQYKIQTSTDGTTFTTRATVSPTSAGVKTTTFTPVTARYVRILGVTRATPWGFSFWEAQVFSGTSSPPPTQVELAKGQPASASSQETAALAPPFANDGNATTRWSSAWQDNQWWQVDLGSAKQVNQVTINWETAYASQYKIQTSTDGTTFTTQATVNIGASGAHTTSFPAVSARYVRVLGVTRATQWGISFWEAQVFGPSS